MSGAEITRDALLNAITAALKARDMPAVAGFIRRLAVASPHDAEAFLAVLDMAGRQ